MDRNISIIKDLDGQKNENSEIERYNVFHASMLIRHAQDGKLYLYDILDIKKETSNLFKL